MAVKASVTITISKYRDTDSITRYYKLQASTAAAPAVPTTLTPSGWSTSEPTYTSGSTNTLYYTDCVIFSDGTFQYTDDGNGKAVKSSSYEAAKEAYNKAQAAQNTANTTQENLDNLEIGARNLIKDTQKFYKNVSSSSTLLSDNYNGCYIRECDTLSMTSGTKDCISYQSIRSNQNIDFKAGEIYTLSFWIKVISKNTSNVNTAFYAYFYGNTRYTPARRLDSSFVHSIGNYSDGSTNYYDASLEDNKWHRIYITWEIYPNATDAQVAVDKHILVMRQGCGIKTQICGVKFEKGNRQTDWSPAPEDYDDTITSVVNLYYASDSSTPPTKPNAHVGTNSASNYNQWNIALPTYNENYPYLYTCKETLNKGGLYAWTTVEQTTYAEAVKTIQTELNTVQADYLKETTFSDFKREQKETDTGIMTRLKQTSVTVYGNEDGTIDPEDANAIINHLNKVDNDLNGENGAIDRLGTAEDTLEGSGLNEYDQSIKITQRFLNVETDVQQIKNIFKITGGTNLIQNSVGYFADNNNKPNMWNVAANTIYSPFGYDADLIGATISRGKLFCAKGSMTTTPNNIMALLSNKVMSISFKYKNGANATSKIKVFNGSITYFEKTFNTTQNNWTEVTGSFTCTSNSLQITIESTNSTNNNGFTISDLMLNYGDVKPWELCSNEVYGAMVKLSSLGIEVTATTANTKNFMTTDGILVFRYDPATDSIVGTEPITKITDNGTLTNRLESTGDIIERNLINTMMHLSGYDMYIEYIK